MGFKEDFAAAGVGPMLEYHGDATVIQTKPSGATKSFTAIAKDQGNQEPDEEDGRIVVRRKTLKFSSSDSDGSATVGVGDTFKINSVEGWGFEHFLKQDENGWHVISVKLNAPLTKSRRDRDFRGV